MDEDRLAAFLRFLRRDRFLRREGGPPVLGLEVICLPPETPTETLKRAKEVFDAAWELSGGDRG